MGKEALQALKPRVFAIISGILLFYSALVFFVGWNIWIWLNTLFSLEHAGIYTIVIGVIAYSYLLGRLHVRLAPLKIIGSYWFAVVQYGAILFPLADLLVLLLQLFSVPTEKSVFWVGIFLLISFIGIFLRGTWNAWNPIVRKYELSIPKRAGSYKQLRIAMASDIHLGWIVGKSHLQRLIREVDALRPDIMLLPGDVLDDDIEPFIRKNMASVMKNLRAPLGVYAILGNHEYIGGKIPEYLKQMEAIDVRVLVDETIKIDDSFYLIGRKDRAAGERKSLEELLVDVDPGAPLIVMDHQPYHLEVAARNGIDLMLSGHTHRGQLAPNHLITRRIFELDWGYKQKRQLHAIVSSGFGFWGPPLRLGSRSELIQIDITFTSQAE